IYNPSSLPDEFRSDTPSHGATPALLWVMKHYEQLSPQTQQELSGYPLKFLSMYGVRVAEARPTISDV
ncbi:MAG: hypothetical protein ABIH66_09365, partial [bacterium]